MIFFLLESELAAGIAEGTLFLCFFVCWCVLLVPLSFGCAEGVGKNGLDAVSGTRSGCGATELMRGRRVRSRSCKLASIFVPGERAASRLLSGRDERTRLQCFSILFAF